MADWKRQLARARERQQRRPPRVVAYNSDEFGTPEEAALASTRQAGCTCDPEIRVDGQDVHVKHDQWCALLRRQRDLS